MNHQEVVVYTSENNHQCDKLLGKLNKWEIDYKQRNVTKNKDYLDELQEEGIYGTPATFIDKEVVLGNQVNKIKHALGIMEYYQSHNE